MRGVEFRYSTRNAKHIVNTKLKNIIYYKFMINIYGKFIF